MNSIKPADSPESIDTSNPTRDNTLLEHPYTERLGSNSIKFPGVEFGFPLT